MLDAAGPPLRELRLGGHELLLELAAGGMATVYVAKKVGAAGFEKLVVVKRVHPSLARDREFADMFRDEARVCATIRHPNVVSTLDVVEAGGELFLVIEYVESMPLSALVAAAKAKGTRLPPAVVVRIVADALAGLHAAHEATDLRGERLEVIHRDVSPQNIIVGLDGQSRLIDFGIAKATARLSVTHSGVLKGKLGYMSPEQVRRRPLDRRADVFAAGVVLFEALTGSRLFTGEDEGDVVLGILVAEVPPPSTLVAGIPAGLDAVVARALARDREERYQTAAELAEALEAALAHAPARDVGRVVEAYGGEGLAERRRALQAAMDRPGDAEPVEAVARSGAPPGGAALTVRDEAPVRRSRGAVGALLAGGMLAAAGLGAAFVGRAHGSGPAGSVSAAVLAPPSVAPSPSPVPAPSASAPAASSSASPPSTPSAPPSATARPSPAPAPGKGLHRKDPYATP